MRVTDKLKDVAGTANANTGAIYMRLRSRQDCNRELTDIDRDSLLNWIDTAIGDLESLKRMLNGENKTRVSSLVRKDNSTDSNQ